MGDGTYAAVVFLILGLLYGLVYGVSIGYALALIRERAVKWLERKLTFARVPVGVAVVLALLSLLLLNACASAQMRLGREPAPKGVDTATVEGLVCRGELSTARLYCEDRGASRAEVVERIESALKATKGKPGCCSAEGKCGGGN